jgi:hypothetical protein
MLWRQHHMAMQQMHTRWGCAAGPRASLLRRGVAPPLRRERLVVKANLSDKGRAISPGAITVKRQMGEGSFGQVFEVGSAMSLPLHCNPIGRWL